MLGRLGEQFGLGGEATYGLASLDARQTLDVSVRLDFGWDRRRQPCPAVMRPVLGVVIPLPPSRRFSGAVEGSGSL